MDSDNNFTHQSQSIISKLIPEYNSTPLVLSVIFKIYSLLMLVTDDSDKEGISFNEIDGI